MLRSLLLYLSTKRQIGEALDRFDATKRSVRRFVAGESVKEALAAVQRLNDQALLSAITYLGENVATPKEAREAAEVYCLILDRIRERALRCTPSLKLTHMGLDLGKGICLENVERVLSSARNGGTLVWIDMESTAYTDVTLRIFRELRQRYDNVAAVIQASLRRSEADLRELIEVGVKVRLCKGAYKEPPDRAFHRKAQVDRNYARLMGMLLSDRAQMAGVYPAFATHDDRLIRLVIFQAKKLGIPKTAFEFQMLYGIRPDLHRTLPQQDVQLRILVPFGREWFGYFVRRLAERPANLTFFLGNLWRR